MDVVIRRAILKDESNVRNVVRKSFQQYVPVMGREPRPMNADFLQQIEAGQIYVAEIGGHIVGAVTFCCRDDHMLLDSLAVDSDFSRKGIGKKLIELVENRAKEQHLFAVELCTNQLMIDNIAIYKHLGFDEIGRGNESGFHRVFFRKSL